MRNLSVFTILAFVAVSHAASLFTNSGLSTLSATDDQVQVPGYGTFTAGPFDCSIDGGATFRAFCGDLGHYQNTVPTLFAAVDTASKGANYGKAAQLLYKYGSVVGNDPLKNAALQGAIWSAIYNVTATDGTTGVGTLIGQYLNSDLTGYSTHATYYDMGTLNQGQIRAMPVPEPASMAAMAVGALGLLRRKRRVR